MPSPDPELVPGKYARIERERRFLLAGLPIDEPPVKIREIADHYVIGTSLRLRHLRGPDGHQYKLTQKIPAACPGPVQGLITNVYLSKDEHDQLVAALPGRPIAKTRYSIPPLGIDVFEPPLRGLVIGEAEFDTDADMLAFQPDVRTRRSHRRSSVHRRTARAHVQGGAALLADGVRPPPTIGPGS